MLCMVAHHLVQQKARLGLSGAPNKPRTALFALQGELLLKMNSVMEFKQAPLKLE